MSIEQVVEYVGSFIATIGTQLEQRVVAIRNVNVVRFAHDLILLSKLLYDCYIIIMM